MSGDWQWTREEYRENLVCLRQFVKDTDTIARNYVTA